MNQHTVIDRLRLIRRVHVGFVIAMIAYYIYASLTVASSLENYNPDVAPSLLSYVGAVAVLYAVPAILIGIILSSVLIGRLKRAKPIGQTGRKVMVIGLACYALFATLIGKVVMDFGHVDCGDRCAAAVTSYGANLAVAIANGLLCLAVTAWLYWALAPVPESA